MLKITAKEYYSQYDYLEFSATSNKPENLTDNGDGTYTMIAKTNSGRKIRLLIEGEIDDLDGGWGVFNKDTKIYTLDALPGINFFDYTFTSNSDKTFFFGEYYSLIGDTSVQSFGELYGEFLREFNGRSSDGATEFDIYPIIYA